MHTSSKLSTPETGVYLAVAAAAVAVTVAVAVVVVIVSRLRQILFLIHSCYLPSLTQNFHNNFGHLCK